MDILCAEDIDNPCEDLALEHPAGGTVTGRPRPAGSVNAPNPGTDPGGKAVSKARHQAFEESFN